MLKVAVIGAGRMGRIRAAAAKALGARVVAVCDPCLERAVELTDELGDGASVMTREQLEWSSYDAAFVCTPPSEREDARRAIDSGVHVMTEKPLALSAAAARSLLESAEKSSVVTAVGFMNRYRKSVQDLKDNARSDTPLGLTVHWAGGRYGVPWWADPGRSGGPIVEQCTHLADLCRYLCGDVETVHAMGNSNGSAADVDLAAIGMRFRSGPLATILYTCNADAKQISLSLLTKRREHRLEGWDFRDPASANEDVDRNEIFRIETKAFFDAIASGDKTLVLSDFHEAARTQSVVDAVLQSIGTGRTVSL